MKRPYQIGEYGEIVRPRTKGEHLLRPGCGEGAIVLALNAQQLHAIVGLLAGRPPEWGTADEEMIERLDASFVRNREETYEVVSCGLMTPWQAHPDHLRHVISNLVQAAYDLADGTGDIADLVERAEEAEMLAAWFDDPQAMLAGETFVPARRPVGPDDVVTSLLDEAATRETGDES